MPETLDIQREWASTLKTLLKTRGQITTQLDRHLVNTGRAADPDIADDAVAESSRAHREDMVQNLVADRSEISANVAFTETEAALNPKGQHTAAVAAHSAATVRKVKADKAVVDAQAASAKLKNPTPAQTADQNAVLADALAEQAAAIAAIHTALAAIAPAEAKVAARKLVIDARVAARSQHLRDSADTSDPAVRAAKKRALIAHDANLTDAAAEAMEIGRAHV